MNSKSPRMAPLSIFKSGLTKFGQIPFFILFLPFPVFNASHSLVVYLFIVGEVKEPYDTSALGPGAYNFSITVVCLGN